jgi:FkbM family methyltransferase
MFLDRYELAETALVRTLSRPGLVVVDVGAHIGWYSTLAGLTVGATGRVFAFEADAANEVLLRRNIELNSLDECVTALRVAVTDEPGTLQIGRQAGSDSGSSTAAPRDRPATAPVPAAPLDQLVTDPRRIALLKVDVEGLEPAVLRGGEETLRRTDAVLIELNESALNACGSSTDEVLSLLEAAGLSNVRPVSPRGLDRLRRGGVLNALVTRSPSAAAPHDQDRSNDAREEANRPRPAGVPSRGSSSAALVSC